MKSIALASLLTGCVPYAIPPTTSSVGAQVTSERGTRVGVHVDVGFAPLQLTRSQLFRRWDATLGGSYDRTGTQDAWGVVAAAGPVLFPWGRALREPRVQRALPQLVGRWTTDGTSVGARVTVEATAFAHGVGTSSNAAAVGIGELAVGLYAESTRRDDGVWLVTAGVTLRTPAALGIVCCAR